MWLHHLIPDWKCLEDLHTYQPYVNAVHYSTQTEYGTQVQGLSPGTWIVPLHSAMGTWRSAAVLKAADCFPVPSDLPIEATATLCIKWVSLP